MRDLTKYIDKGIIALDREAKVLSWNRWLETKTGISEKDMLAKSLHSVFPEIENRLSYKQLGRAIQSKNSLVLSPVLHKFLIPINNPQLYRKQGMEQMIQLTHGMAVVEDGEYSCYIVQIEDHTDKFLKEIKLKKFYDDLAKKNEELAKIQKELETKNEILENTNSYKSEFLANMSHEIRTPMNSIMGVTELLIESSEPLSDSQKEMLNVINLSSSSLMELINDILDLAKTSAQKLELEKVEFDLEAMLIDLFKVIASRTFDKDLELICNTPKLEKHVICDITRLKQILTNLLGNAAKFTDNGFIRLNIDLDQDQKNIPPRLSIQVSDSGIGVSKNNLEKIFDSFVQADGSTTRKFGGTGLGLSLCKELITLMDGSISAESEFGEGTTFKIEFPISFGAPLPELVAPYTLTEKRILYIDRSVDNQKQLSEIASSLGLSISVCSTNDPLKKITEQCWDIILIEQSSITNQNLKALKNCKDSKIINIHKVLSNSFSGDSTFHHHLSTPFSRKHFLSILSAKINSKVITSVNEFDVTGTEKTKILIAEDNKSNQFLLKKILQNKFDFEFANNGQEAVNMTKENSYDIILMDILMPIMDGHEATIEIRKFNLEIPILALTANNLVSDKEKCLKSGMNDYLTKPINRDQLIEKIKSFSCS
ncbi:MAG: ATP-binding protein [Lentisphaeraceae bacterium]|nr:ATP-binding protein [Lentisphaeraceae bacterium]